MFVAISDLLELLNDVYYKDTHAVTLLIIDF